MNYRAGFVGLIGLPNGGKSTLANTLVSEKVSIVTAKPQTTRQRVMSVFSDKQSQILFVDAPGYVSKSSGLNQFLADEYRGVIQDSDALVAVLNIDHSKLEDLLRIAQTCAEAGKKWMVVITKIDCSQDYPEPQRLGILCHQLKKYSVSVVAVSALKNPKQAQQLVLPEIRHLLPESSAPLYDPEIYTTQNLREMAGEVVREKCFEFLHQEIPYGLAVKVKKFVENAGPTVKVYADILVNKEGHRGIVVGKGGLSLKRIGQRARTDLERLLGRKVYLELYVVVCKNWVKNPLLLQELGYVVS